MVQTHHPQWNSVSLSWKHTWSQERNATFTFPERGPIILEKDRKPVLVWTGGKVFLRWIFLTCNNRFLALKSTRFLPLIVSHQRSLPNAFSFSLSMGMMNNLPTEKAYWDFWTIINDTYLRIEIGWSFERFVKFLWNSGNLKELERNAFSYKFSKDAVMSYCVLFFTQSTRDTCWNKWYAMKLKGTEFCRVGYPNLYSIGTHTHTHKHFGFSACMKRKLHTL